MANKPLLFLNVDGVLTNAGTYLCAKRGAKPRDFLDSGAIALIDKLCSQIDAEVVMATAWERFYPTAADWVSLFEEFGASIPVVDVLPRAAWLSDPQQAILAVVAARGAHAYLILDDDAAYPSDAPFVQTNPRVGLTVREVASALAHLAPNAAPLCELRGMSAEFWSDRLIFQGPLTRAALILDLPLTTPPARFRRVPFPIIGKTIRFSV